MSIKSWKTEFYPIPADMVSATDAVEHSAQKWRGVLPENLREHGLRRVRRVLVSKERGDAQMFTLNGDTCALCHHYFFVDDDSPTGDYVACPDCPIVKNGSPDCDAQDSLYRKATGSRGDDEEETRNIKALIAAITGKEEP